MADLLRVTQQQFLDACPAEPLGVWLHFSFGEAVELVDFQVTPVGPAIAPTLDTEPATWDRPLVLTRAESWSGAIPLQAPLWLRQVEAGPEQPNHGGRRNLNLYVNRGDAYDPVVKIRPPPALRAADQVRYVSLEEQATAVRNLTSPSGQLGGYLWVLEYRKRQALPVLYVPQGTEDLAAQWAELYARLVLGEEG